jgi:hypothetical protein
MAVYTFTAPENRTASQTLTDVTTVRIEDKVYVDFITNTLTFRYSKGRISGSIYIPEYTSGDILVTGADFTAIMAAAVDANYSLRSNLEGTLLQYLEDKGVIAAGTVAL